MSFLQRLTIALLCGILAAGNLGGATSMWLGAESEAESSDQGGDSETENEADSLELALPGRHDPLALFAAAAAQPDSHVVQRSPSLTQASFVPPNSLSVGSGVGGPLRC